MISVFVTFKLHWALSNFDFSLLFAIDNASIVLLCYQWTAPIETFLFTKYGNKCKGKSPTVIFIWYNLYWYLVYIELIGSWSLSISFSENMNRCCLNHIYLFTLKLSTMKYWELHFAKMMLSVCVSTKWQSFNYCLNYLCFISPVAIVHRFKRKWGKEIKQNIPGNKR